MRLLERRQTRRQRRLRRKRTGSAGCLHTRRGSNIAKRDAVEVKESAVEAVGRRGGPGRSTPRYKSAEIKPKGQLNVTDDDEDIQDPLRTL